MNTSSEQKEILKDLIKGGENLPQREKSDNNIKRDFWDLLLETEDKTPRAGEVKRGSIY